MYQKERLQKDLVEVQRDVLKIVRDKEEKDEDVSQEIYDIVIILRWFIDGIATDVIRNYEKVAERIGKIREMIGKIT